MTFSKETAFSLIRAAAIGFGSYLIGSNFRILGNVVDATLWEGIVGIMITAAGVIWGIFDKTATIEATSSGIKSVIVFVGGLLVASGKIKAEVLSSIIGVVTIVLPVWLGSLERKKLRKIDNNELMIVDTEGKLSKNIRKAVVKTPNNRAA